MEMLLRSSTDANNPIALSVIKSTDITTIATVIQESSNKAKEVIAGTKTSTDPLITTCADAMDVADRKNQLTQAVIGVKEGASATIEYELYELFAVAFQAAYCPQVQAIHQQLVAAILHRFNFRQRFSDNVAVLRTKNARIATYGIIIHEDMIANIVLAEADQAAHKEWGREIGTAMDEIRLLYRYDYSHDATSVTIFLKELAVAEAIRTLLDTLTLTNAPIGLADTMVELSSHVQ